MREIRKSGSVGVPGPKSRGHPTMRKSAELYRSVLRTATEEEVIGRAGYALTAIYTLHARRSSSILHR